MQRIVTALILLATTVAYADVALVFTGSTNIPRVHAVGDPCPGEYHWNSQLINNGTLPTDDYQANWNPWQDSVDPTSNESEIPGIYYARGLPVRHRYSCDGGQTWSTPSAWYVVGPLRGDVDNNCFVNSTDFAILNMNFGSFCQ